MSELEYNVEIVDTTNEIRRKVTRDLQRGLNKVLPRIIGRIENRLRSNLGDFFYDSDEYSTILRTGRGDFGFEAGTATSRLRAIINALQDTVQVTYKKISVTGTRLRGGITVEAFPDDFSYILGLPEAQVTTERGEVLTWLFEMLFSGNRIIVANYEVEFGPSRGRSGIAIMVKKSGGAWRVPPTLAGTRADNWITRSVNSSRDFIERTIQGAIEAEFNSLSRGTI